MSLNTLTGNSLSATRSQILHIGTGTLAAGAVIRLGDGTTTPLTISSAGISVAGSIEATSIIATSITGTTITATTIVLNGVTLRAPVYKLISAANISNSSSTVYTDLTEFSFTPVSGATYEVELCLIWTAALTTTGIVVKNSGGSVTGFLANSHDQAVLVMGSELIYPTSPYATATKFGYQTKGVVVASSTAPITWQIRSEVNTSQVTLFTGSFLKITRIS